MDGKCAAVLKTSMCCFELTGCYQLKFEVWAKRAECTAGTFHWMVLLKWASILESVTSLSCALAAVCGGLPLAPL